MLWIEFPLGRERVSIDAHRISSVREDREGMCTRIYIHGEKEPWKVTELYYKVMEKIREATAEDEPEEFTVHGFVTAGGMADDEEIS